MLLAIAGVAAVLNAFKTDAPGRDATWHGTVHWMAYFIFLVSLVTSYPVTWWRVRGHGLWREAPRWPSLFALLLFPPVYLLPDRESAGNYLFSAVVLTPLAVIAIRISVGALRVRPDSGSSGQS